MSTIITNVVNTTSIISCEFVKLTIQTPSTSTVVAMTSGFRDETVGGVTYKALGGLVQVGQQQRDLKVTGFDTSISLVGIDPVNMNMVLTQPIRGSEIEIYRAFYDTSYTLVNTVKRFTGIVTSYTIAENREGQDDFFGIVLNCSNYKTVLENNIGGRRTNRDDWSYFYGTTDNSMDSVEKLAGAYFDFGVPK